MRRWPVVLAVMLLGGPLVCVAWFFVEAHQRIERKREVAAREIPRVLALLDGRLDGLFDSTLLARPDGDDAGPFLNERLDFPRHPSARPLLPEHCDATLREYSQREAELPTKLLAECDSSVLSDLRRFERWSLTAGVRQTMPAGPRGDDALPDLLVLQRLVKIHLLKAHAMGDFAAAINDVRHLARLLFTQEYLLTTMFGVALLGISHRLAEALGENTTFPETQAQLDALRSRMFVSFFSVNPLAPPSQAQDVRSAPRFARCVTLTEEAFDRQLTSLPVDADCSLENARFELAHPWKGLELDSLAALSAPARLGGHIAYAFIDCTPARNNLLSADELPAGDDWENATPESMTRLMSP